MNKAQTKEYSQKDEIHKHKASSPHDSIKAELDKILKK
jgi:hypothetical protein